MTGLRFQTALWTLLWTVTPVALTAQQQGAVRLDTLTVNVAGSVSIEGHAAARSVEVIDRERIDRLGTSLGEVLARALAVDVYTRSPAQADIAIRGSSFEQVLVLIDGVRASDDQTGHFDLDTAVPLDMVERIEILRGPGSALYGPDAVGGVINIVTAASPATRVSVGAGEFATLGASAAGGMRGEASSLSAAADYRTSDGHRDGTDYKIGQGRISAGRSLGAGQLRADAGVCYHFQLFNLPM
jgi:iron complex outermembrane receptor protein